MDIRSRCDLINGKAGDIVHKDMVFISSVELVVLFICLVRSRMNTELAILICLGLAVGMKLIFAERLWIILRSVGKNRGEIQLDKRSIQGAKLRKGKDLFFHNVREDRRIKVFQKAVKSPVRGKRRSNIKTAVMCDEKIVVEIIDKVGKHGETFALHDNERTEHCMIGKAFSSGFRKFRNRG